MIPRRSIITTGLLSLVLLSAAATSASNKESRRPPRTGLFHRNGRIIANLPPDGSLSQAWYEESLAGLRWPGQDGAEFAGGGGFYLRFRTGTGEVCSYFSPEDFDLIQDGSSGVNLFEGCGGGKRHPASGCDDDGDGQIDEDPFDGLDNDGDGSIDEDFDAIGHSMAVSRAGIPEAGLFLTQSSYVWSFGHVRDFIAFSSRIDYSPADPESAGVLKDFAVALSYDPDIGKRSDENRGLDDEFFFIRRPHRAGFGDQQGHIGSSFPDGRHLFFAGAGGGSAEGSYTAMILLGTDQAGRNVPPVLKPASLDMRSIWDSITEEVAAGRHEEPAPQEGNAAIGEKALEYLPMGDYEVGGDIQGDLRIINIAAGIPELEPGDGVRIDWAIVFGKTPEKLASNVERAIETYRGAVGSGEIGQKWIVPARKAERIEVPARLAPVWMQGRRLPAVSIELPIECGEDVEWLKISTARIENFEQVEGRVLVTIEPDLIEAGSALMIEGQLTDGTIFRAIISTEDIEVFEGDDSTAPDKLPEDCLKTFPNPFVLDLNISLNVHGSASQLYRANDRETSGISSVRIYDVKGRLVKTVLEEEFLHPGEYSMGWDGKDENGMAVQPGVYYCKLQIGDRSVTKRVVLLR